MKVLSFTPDTQSVRSGFLLWETSPRGIGETVNNCKKIGMV